MYVKNLVYHLTKLDSQNQYFLLFDRNGVSEKEIGFSLPGNFKIVAILPSYKLLWTMYSMPKWIKKNTIDVLHVQYITPLWLPGRTKLITTIHDVSWKFFPLYIKRSDLFFLNILIPLSIKRANKVITVSHTSREDIIKIYKLSPGKVVSIYNGVDKELFNNTNDIVTTKIIQKYKLPEKYIFYVGTLQPRKNIPALIRAFNVLITKYNIPDIKLVVGGGKSHNYDERIDSVIKQYGLENKIIPAGYIDQRDLPYLYKLAKVFVFPSLYEGFGIPVIEAMACGTPVVVADKSCLPEVAGQAGLAVDPAQTEKFADTIYKALSDEKIRKELISKGYERAKEFDWKNTAQQTFIIYTHI